MQHKLKQAVDLVVSKHNILLTANSSDRQAFIQQLFNQLPHNIMPCSIDLADIKNDVDVIECFYYAIITVIEKSVPNKTDPNLRKLSNFFTEANVPLHQQCSALTATYGFREVIEYLLSALTIYCQTNAFSHVVIAIDNFDNINTIKQLKLDATLRKFSQLNQAISFIFTGDPVKVAKLFNHYQQPLFAASTLINLKHKTTRCHFRSAYSRCYQIKFTRRNDTKIIK